MPEQSHTWLFFACKTLFDTPPQPDGMSDWHKTICLQFPFSNPTVHQMTWTKDVAYEDNNAATSYKLNSVPTEAKTPMEAISPSDFDFLAAANAVEDDMQPLHDVTDDNKL